MLLCLINHKEFEFFAEKRLIFKDPDKPAPSPKQQLADIKGDLAALRAELEDGDEDEDEDDAGTPAKPKKTSYHTDVHKASRGLEAPKPRHRKSSEISRKAIKLKDALEPKEVMDIQRAHEGMYEQYMNPAFMNHMKQRGKAVYDKAYKALDLAINNPFALEYVKAGANKLKIVKKRPHKEDAIPKNFEIIMETNPINVVKIDGIDLRTPSGEIAWVSNKEYNKRMKDYQERWNNEHRRRKYSNYDEKLASLPVTEPARTKAWRKLSVESLMAVSKDMQDMVELDNIHFPRRFVALVAARGAGFEFEEKDPRFKEVKKFQAKQGKNYKEVVEENSLYLLVFPDPKMKGVYRIRAASGPLASEELRVTAEGYMMVQKPDGSWVPDPRYHQTVRRQYYKKNPTALATLTPAEQAELAALNKKIPTQTEKLEKERKAREKREKVDAALNKADLATLKEVAKAIAPERHAAIDKLKGEKGKVDLRKAIKKYLDEDDPDGKHLDKTAEMLGIEEEKELTPAEKERKEKRGKVDAALDKADLATLKEVAKAIAPERHAAIDKLKGEKGKVDLRKAIKKYLDEDDPDGKHLDTAAEILKAAETEKVSKSPKQKAIAVLKAMKTPTKAAAIAVLDLMTDAEKVKLIIKDLGPKGEAAKGIEKQIEKQKEQIKGWLNDGTITVSTLATKLIELAQ